MRYEVALILLLGCSSPKANIGGAAEAIHRYSSDIEAEAGYGRGQLEGVLGMVTVEVVRGAIKGAIAAFKAIEVTAEKAHKEAEKITENLEGVKDVGWSIWAKLGLGAGLLGMIGLVAVRFGAGGLLLTLVSSLLGRVSGLFGRKGS